MNITIKQNNDDEEEKEEQEEETKDHQPPKYNTQLLILFAQARIRYRTRCFFNSSRTLLLFCVLCCAVLCCAVRLRWFAFAVLRSRFRPLPCRLFSICRVFKGTYGIGMVLCLTVIFCFVILLYSFSPFVRSFSSLLLFFFLLIHSRLKLFQVLRDFWLDWSTNKSRMDDGTTRPRRGHRQNFQN